MWYSRSSAGERVKLRQTDKPLTVPVYILTYSDTYTNCVLLSCGPVINIASVYSRAVNEYPNIRLFVHTKIIG